MSKVIKRLCPGCNTVKEFRADNKTCGCKKTAPVLKEVNEVAGDKWTITLPKTRIHTLEDLLAAFEVDTEIWEVEKFVCNKWEMGYVTDKLVGPKKEDGSQDTKYVADYEELYQVKAFLVRKKVIENIRNEIAELKELAKREAPLPIKVRKLNKASGHVLEINIADHHFGKLAWKNETGDQNYDTKIALQCFQRALETILDRVSAYTFDEIIFIIGNDLFNADDTEGRTTKGTYVSSDIRYQKTFSVVRTAMTDAIERLRRLTKMVRVIMVSGNHDHLSVWHLGDSLECYFTKYSDVTIDNSPKYHKYYQYGKVMIAWTHGDKGKIKDLPLLMATEQPVMFGATKFREAHTGHKHHKSVEEQHGVIVRILSSLSPADAWHAEQGFTGNLRSAEAFIWHKDEGLVGTVVYTDSREDIEEE